MTDEQKGEKIKAEFAVIVDRAVAGDELALKQLEAATAAIVGVLVTSMTEALDEAKSVLASHN